MAATLPTSSAPPRASTSQARRSSPRNTDTARYLADHRRLWGCMGNEQEGVRTTSRVGDSWRAEVLARVAVVRGMADAASTGSDAVNDRRLRAMSTFCSMRPSTTPTAFASHALRWLDDWRNGGSIERAWRNLHAAEILLAEIVDLDQLASQLPAVRSMAQRGAWREGRPPTRHRATAHRQAAGRGERQGRRFR